VNKFDRERLDALVAEGWLRSQRHPEADLWIYNYTERTQFEKHWTPETLACRGLILDVEGAVVARPFPKFFNLHELPDLNTSELGTFTVAEKVDGSLGIAYPLGDEWRLATRGSFTSEQAIEGTRILHEHGAAWHRGETALFEIVYPANRIVVDYGGDRKLVLLAVLDNLTAEDRPHMHGAWPGEKAERHYLGFEELVDQDRPNCEGYVVTFTSGLRVKIKHAEYVRLHRIVTGINARRIWEALAAGQDPVSELDGIPDEIFAWVDSTTASLRDEFRAQVAAAQALFEGKPPTDDRREIAEYFKRCGGNTAVLFRMLDGKPYEDLIWKAIKPEPTTPDTIWNTEVVA